MKDLFLHFRSVDKNGNGVFDVYDGSEHQTMEKKKGEVRLNLKTYKPASTPLMRVCWKAHPSIKCACEECIADRGEPTAALEGMWDHKSHVESHGTG